MYFKDHPHLKFKIALHLYGSYALIKCNLQQLRIVVNLVADFMQILPVPLELYHESIIPDQGILRYCTPFISP